jgi:membrane protein YqaA with SNARE-associated domain
MIRRLYTSALEWAGHKNAPKALSAIAFAESSFFLIPPDTLLIPMCLAKRERALWYATLCTFWSVVGGIAGYAIGSLLFDSFGQSILEFYGLEEKFKHIKVSYNKWGAWIVFTAGLTPFPYKLITISSGVTKLNLLTFIIASILSRGLRFYTVAGLLWYFGEPIKHFIEKNLPLLAILFCILLFGAFALLKFL